MEVGSIVALLVEKYNERPQIGRVKEVKGDSIRVEWYDGTWYGKWKLYKYREGRRTVVWEEDLKLTCIVHKNVTFSADGRLHPGSRRDLRKLY